MTGASRLRTAMCVAGSTALSLAMATSARSAAPLDAIYIHCDNAGGDFRISDLNHSIYQFMAKYQEYRPLCSECDITEWGDRITMKNGLKTFIQVSRISGQVVVQRNIAKQDGGPFEIYSFQGICRRSAMVLPKKRANGRAF